MIETKRDLYRLFSEIILIVVALATTILTVINLHNTNTIINSCASKKVFTIRGKQYICNNFPSGQNKLITKGRRHVKKNF